MLNEWEYASELLWSGYKKSHKILSLWMTAAIGNHKLYPQSLKKIKENKRFLKFQFVTEKKGH